MASFMARDSALPRTRNVLTVENLAIWDACDGLVRVVVRVNNEVVVGNAAVTPLQPADTLRDRD